MASQDKNQDNIHLQNPFTLLPCNEGYSGSQCFPLLRFYFQQFSLILLGRLGTLYFQPSTCSHNKQELLINAMALH